MDNDKYSLGVARTEQWDEIISLVWKTFLRFEAEVYGTRGTETFQRFLFGDALREDFLSGRYVVYVAAVRTEIIGMISMRDIDHISLLFVDENYQRMGIGRSLVLRLWEELKRQGVERMTVNAAPYGLPFYDKMGFVRLCSELESEGIKYTPMFFTGEGRMKENG